MPWPWTEEIARFCLIWFAPAAAAIGIRQGHHFAFHWGIPALDQGARKLLRQASNTVIVIFLVLLLYEGFGFLDVVANQTAMATELNMRLPTFGIVFGISALIAMHVLEIADACIGHFTGVCLSIRELREVEAVKVLQTESPASPEPGIDPAFVQK